MRKNIAMPARMQNAGWTLLVMYSSKAMMPAMVTLSRVMMLFAKSIKKRTTGTSRKIAITRNRVIIHFLSPRHWPGQIEGNGHELCQLMPG